MALKMFAFGLFMLQCIVQSSATLKCYNCSGSECGDIDNSGLQLEECNEDVLSQSYIMIRLWNAMNGNSDANEESLTPTCLKFVTRINGDNVVGRRCSLKSPSYDPCRMSESVSAAFGEQIPTIFCGTCDTDGCNSGNSLQLFSALIVFAAMVSIARIFV